MFITMTIELVLIIAIYYIAKKVEFIKSLYVIFGAIVSVFYIVYRGVFTLNYDTIVGFLSSIILYSAELLGFLSFFIFILVFRLKSNYKKPQKKEFKSVEIDVFIATYNESSDLVLKTAIAASQLEYDNKINIFICDDKSRDEINFICDEYGFNHITRLEHDHAKAGNYNNALKFAKSEYILFLDADMVVKPNFLKETMWYFNDSNCALVQTPQVFYNPDPYQYISHKTIKNEQDYFMQSIEPNLGRHNAVLHVGTNAVFRRSALDKIGGIPTGSLTEDMATGLLLQQHGYNTYFENQKLAFGLSAKTIDDMLKQRARWGRGAIQVARHYNPFNIKKLTFMQKTIYFNNFIYWLSPIQKFIYIVAPLLYIYFNIKVIDASYTFFLTLQIPTIVLSLYVFQLISNNSRSFFWAHIYDLITMPTIGTSIFSEIFFKHKDKFDVTSKNTKSDKTSINLKNSGVFIIISIILFISILYAVVQVSINGLIPFTIGYIICSVWCLYNLIGLVYCTYLTKQKPVYREYERIEVKDYCLVNHHTTKVYDFSDFGMRLELVENINVGDIVNIELDNNYYEGEVRWTLNDQFGIMFVNVDKQSRINLVNQFVKYEHDYTKGVVCHIR